jgi:hypothetical protein
MGCILEWGGGGMVSVLNTKPAVPTVHMIVTVGSTEGIPHPYSPPARGTSAVQLFGSLH